MTISTELARHDVRLSRLEDFEGDTKEVVKGLLTALTEQKISLIQYRASNRNWGLTLTAIQGIITTIALILTGQSPNIASFIAKHF